MIEKLNVIVALSCLGAALTMARPSLASPAPTSPTDPRAVHLQVDVAELGEKGIGLDKVIRDHVGPRIEAAEFTLVDEPEAAMVVRLRLRVLESSPYDYGVHFEFIDGTTREPAVEWTDCHACIDAKLMPILDERIPSLLLALDERAKRVAAEAESASSGDTNGEAPSEVDPVVSQPKPKPITGMGIGGSVVAGLGVGALIGGTIELSRGVTTESFGRYDRDRIDHRSPGLALVGVGVAAVVVGAVLVGVDVGRQSKRRRQADARQSRVFPICTPDVLGVGITANF